MFNLQRSVLITLHMEYLEIVQILTWKIVPFVTSLYMIL